MATVRYIATDVEATAAFYVERLGFEAAMVTPGFAMLQRDDLRLLLNKPGAGGAGQNDPSPGGWARFQHEVSDLDATVAELKAAVALVEDPSGNVVELFEPA